MYFEARPILHLVIHSCFHYPKFMEIAWVMQCFDGEGPDSFSGAEVFDSIDNLFVVEAGC